MKKILFISLLLICAGMAQAQLKVDSLGRIGLSTSSTQYQSSVYLPMTRNKGLFLDYTGGMSGTIYGLQVQSSLNNNYLYNIHSRITRSSQSYGPGYGVYSIAMGANTSTSGSNSYSFYGLITGKGAAVYGGVSGNSYYELSTSYAGYFNGLTHIQGDLSVSGNISGVLLTSSISPSESSPMQSIQELSSRNGLCEGLLGLTAKSFYYKPPRQADGVDEDVEDSFSADAKNPETQLKSESIEPTLSSMEKQIYSKQHYSLSADELEAIFPDLVYENEDGSKSINYVEMVPILVQAIGELSAKVAVLEGKDGAVRKVAARTTGIDTANSSVEFQALGQNKPNPFGTSTEIEVSVPESVQSAFVYVYDLQGKKVQQVNLTARGRQTVQLNATSLADGMYLYSLIADGKVVETRRMIVEK